MKKIVKSIGAILVGFLVVAILSVATDALLEAMHIFASSTNPYATKPWMLVIALIYRSLYTIFGGYTTAMLAPNHPMRHVVILGIIGVILGTLGTIANWKLAVISGIWYPILLLLISFPCIWLGGKLRIKHK